MAGREERRRRRWRDREVPERRITWLVSVAQPASASRWGDHGETARETSARWTLRTQNYEKFQLFAMAHHTDVVLSEGTSAGCTHSLFARTRFIIFYTIKVAERCFWKISTILFLICFFSVCCLSRPRRVHIHHGSDVALRTGAHHRHLSELSLLTKNRHIGFDLICENADMDRPTKFR